MMCYIIKALQCELRFLHNTSHRFLIMPWMHLQCQWQNFILFFCWNLIMSGVGRFHLVSIAQLQKSIFLITLHLRKGTLRRKIHYPGRGIWKLCKQWVGWISWAPLPHTHTKISLLEIITLGVQKAILDNLPYLEDHVSHANAMTTLTSPSLAAVTACLAPVWYVSQVQQAGTVSSVLMDILETQLMQRTVNVSLELLMSLTELIYDTPKKLMSSWVGIGD